MLAVVGISGEWRHRTITSSLLAAPDRVRFLPPRRSPSRSPGCVLSLLIASAVTVVGYAILSSRDLPLPDAGELAARSSAATRSWPRCSARFGVGVGALVRNQVVAIVGLLLIAFVVEPLADRAGARASAASARWARCRPRPPTSRRRRRLRATSTCSRPGSPCWRCWPGSAATFAAAAALLKTRDLT